MYNPQELSQRIKNIAKQKDIIIKDMLAACNLTVNTLSSLNHGKSIAYDSVAKIADYLGCSVDYLLGRTDEITVQNEIELKPEEYPVIVKYRATSEQGRAIVNKLLDELHKQKDAPTAYSDERIEAILQSRPELTELVNQIRGLNREQTLQAIDYIRFLLAQQEKN